MTKLQLDEVVYSSAPYSTHTIDCKPYTHTHTHTQECVKAVRGPSYRITHLSCNDNDDDNDGGNGRLYWIFCVRTFIASYCIKFTDL